MADVRVNLKMSGIRKVLRSSESQGALLRLARRSAAAAGPGFEAVVRPGRFTARALVWTTDDASRRAEAENKALTRSLDAMR